MADYHYKPLDEINFKESISISSGSAQSGFLEAIAGSGRDPSDFNIFIEGKSAQNPFPRNFSQFIDQWRHFVERSPNGAAVVPPPSDIGTAGATALTQQFKSALNTDEDWAPINLNDDQLSAFAVGAFGAFLRQFPYEEFPNGVTSEGFEEEWTNFLTMTAVLLNTSKTGTRANLASFEEIYQAFFPPGEDPVVSQAAFHDRLATFAIDHLRGQSYFLPSHHVDDWMKSLREQWERTLAVKLSPDERLRRNVMLLLFKILRTVLERLQETAAIQAERLRFLTDYQGEYTELMGRVPIYQANPSRLVGSATIWEDVPGFIIDRNDEFDFSDQAAAQLASGVGSNNRGDLWDVKGFAGITLQEIREAGLLMPTVFGYAEWQVREIEAQTDGASTNASGVLIDPVTGQPILQGIERGTQEIPIDSPYYHLRGQPVPGVWWLVEQPYDGSGKYGGSPKTDSEFRQDLNQVRQQWIEQLRSRRNIIKDEAKEAQSAMSNTREAINQQSNLMTSIIQQLSSILQAIFR